MRSRRDSAATAIAAGGAGRYSSGIAGGPLRIERPAARSTVEERREGHRGKVSGYRRNEYIAVPSSTAVAVTCWCERSVVYIPPADVGNTTTTCGRTGCQPPKGEM